MYITSYSIRIVLLSQYVNIYDTMAPMSDIYMGVIYSCIIIVLFHTHYFISHLRKHAIDWSLITSHCHFSFHLSFNYAMPTILQDEITGDGTTSTVLLISIAFGQKPYTCTSRNGDGDLRQYSHCRYWDDIHAHWYNNIKSISRSKWSLRVDPPCPHVERV